MALFGSRIDSNQTARKSTVILDKELFPFIDNLKAGDRGQLDVSLLSVGNKLAEQPDGVEKAIEILEVLKAEPITTKKARIT